MSVRAGGAVPPNILLVVLDTARADAFEPYGARAGSTPAVRQLAADGVARHDAFATACWTVPSHGSMLGGHLPRALNVSGGSTGGNPKHFRAALEAQRDRLLPTVLGRAGWATAGVSTNLWVSEASGFDTGFDDFHYVRAERNTALGASDWRAKARWYLEAARARVDDGAEEVERLLADRLAARPRGDRRPFFWFVNLVESHSPYLPPRPWNDLGLVDRIKSGRDARMHQTFAAFCRASLGGFDIPDEDLERMRHLYGRCVALLDNWLARVRGALDRAGVLEETLIVVTSDHGENLGEGGLMGHCFSLDDRLVRIPLVAAGPGSDAFEGVDAWSLAAMPATLASAVGLDDHPWRESLPDGVAVAQLDAPCAQDDPAAPEAVVELNLPAGSLPLLLMEYAVATDGRWKVRRDDRTADESIIDLDDDPLELQWEPLDATRRARAEAARPGALDRLRAALDFASASEVVERAPAPAFSRPEVDVDDLAARMELLGYL